MLPSQFFMLICFCQFLNYNTPSSHSRSPAATRFTSPWSFPPAFTPITTGFFRTMAGNWKSHWALVTGMVDRDVPLMAEPGDVVVHRRITGGSDNQKRLFQFFQILLAKCVLLPGKTPRLRKLAHLDCLAFPGGFSLCQFSHSALIQPPLLPQNF